ncbi:MAG: FHA domain-containing protein [Myxococcales bacterium]|nr:FHA domain-containing protein [Myxococcales bacterium]
MSDTICRVCKTGNRSVDWTCRGCGKALGENLAPGAVVLRIGRAVENDMVVPKRFDSVGRYHAEVLYNGSGHLLVKDLASRNGTYVDGERVSKGTAAFDLRSELQFGDIRFDPHSVMGLLGDVSIRPATEMEEVRPPEPVIQAKPEPEPEPEPPPPPPPEPPRMEQRTARITGDVRPVVPMRHKEARMIRCDCGMVKREGEACATCGSITPIS